MTQSNPNEQNVEWNRGLFLLFLLAVFSINRRKENT